MEGDGGGGSGFTSGAWLCCASMGGDGKGVEGKGLYCTFGYAVGESLRSSQHYRGSSLHDRHWFRNPSTSLGDHHVTGTCLGPQFRECSNHATPSRFAPLRPAISTNANIPHTFFDLKFATGNHCWCNLVTVQSPLSQLSPFGLAAHTNVVNRTSRVSINCPRSTALGGSELPTGEWCQGAPERRVF